jgi:hypothetical protein
MSLGQQIALAVVIKALLVVSPDKQRIIAAIKQISDSGFKSADARLQAEIDESLTNWINSI